MKWNLPNKLTMFRVFCIPAFAVLFLLSISYEKSLPEWTNFTINWYRIFAAIVFVVASITDYFDGKIAREQNLVTNFGKLMDPLADKMLVVTALMCLLYNNEVNFICVLIVVLRELIISSIRLIALERGIVIAASYWGKLKTATQMIAIVLLLFDVCIIGFWPCIIAEGLFYISTIFCVISLIDYIIKSKEVFLS